MILVRFVGKTCRHIHGLDTHAPKLGYQPPRGVVGIRPDLFEFIIRNGMGQAFEMILVDMKGQYHDAPGARHGIQEVLPVIRHGVPGQLYKPGIIRTGGQGHFL